MPDPVQDYLAKYGKGGKIPSPAPLVAPVDSADPVQSYLAKYRKPGGKPARVNIGNGVLGGLESGIQGMLGGFGDEIGAAGSATIDTASDLFHGRPTQFRKNYVETRDVARALDKGFEEAHPIGHAAAEIAGSIPTLLLTGGAGEAAEGAGLAARVRAAMGTGAKVGAVYGAGNAEGGLTKRVSGAATGALEGAALGAAAPAVGATIRGAPKFLQATTGIGSKDVALTRMGDLLRQTGLSVDEFDRLGRALQKEGAPVVAGEVPGDLGRRYIEFVAGQPSAKGLQLVEKLSERHGGQFDRVTAGLKKAMGQDFMNVPQTEEALIDAQRAHAAPNYEAAYSSGPFSSPNLDAARKIPEFQKALSMGERLAYHDDVLQAMKNGKPIPPPPPSLSEGVSDADALRAAVEKKFADDPKLKAIALAQLGKAPEEPAGVSIKALDYAKRYLDNVIDRGAESGSSFTRTSAMTTNGILKQILGEVDASNPAYKAARSIYSSDARLREVMDLAKNALTMPPEELAEVVKGLSPEELNLARQRFMSAVRDKAGSVSDRADLTNQLLQNPNMRQRFQLLSPNQNAIEELNALKTREGGMAKTYRMAATGSPTAPRLATNEAMQSPVGPADLGVGLISPRRAGMRLIGAAGRVIERHTSRSLADQLAPLLGAEPGTPEWDTLVMALRNQGRGVQALADNHHFLHALAKSFGGVPSENQ